MRVSSRHGVIGAGVVAFSVAIGGVAGWAAVLGTSHATVAALGMVVDANMRRIEHPAGGVIAEIRARDGDRVAAGDIVARFDDGIEKTNLYVVARGLDQLAARKERLEAERDGADAMRFSDDLMMRASNPEISLVLASERKTFELRRAYELSQKSLLLQRIAQYQDQIRGYEAQARSKASEISLVEEELKGARELRTKNLIPISTLNALQRDVIRLEGERQGWLVASTAEARNRIAEVELQVMSIERDRRSEISRELQETDARLGEYMERKATIEDRLKRLDIRAPQDGIARLATPRAIGSVVMAGEEIMQIVPPKPGEPTVEARIESRDIAELRKGQKAVLRVALNEQDASPEIYGRLERISPNATTDEHSGVRYYTAQVAIPADQLARLGAPRLTPGTPVEIVVQTGAHRPFTFDTLRRWLT